MATAGRRAPPIDYLAVCGASDVAGQVVYVSGPKVGAMYQVRQVDIDDQSKLPAAGVIVRKFSSTECLVQTVGVLPGLYTGLTPGRALFVGPSSTPIHIGSVGTPLSSFRPLSGVRWLQPVGVALSDSDISIQLELPKGLRPA